MEFARPTQIDEALALLAKGHWDVLSGGTDYFPGLGDEPPLSPILDISGIETLRGIERVDDGWRIGALTTWTDVIHADLPPAFDALKLAAREVGSVQIQNRATIVGNLCNASPAADGVPPLLVMDAGVELSSSDGQRVIPLGEFVLGNRQTDIFRKSADRHFIERTRNGHSHSGRGGARTVSISETWYAKVPCDFDRHGGGSVGSRWRLHFQSCDCCRGMFCRCETTVRY